MPFSTSLILTKIAKPDRSPSPETHVFFDMVYRNLFLSSAAMMIVFNFLIGAFYYPAILKYQPSADFGRYVCQHQNGEKNLVAYMLGSGYADAFYAQQKPLLTWDPAVFAETLKQKKHLIVYTNPTGIDELNKAHIHYRIIEQRYHYQVARLSLTFLNPATRDAVCDKVYLLEADL
jgi:hypothetical protein